jgi:hypothetical protein
MTAPSAGLSLHDGMLATGMDYHQLWLEYVGISGAAGPFEIEAYVSGLLKPNAYEHDLIAQALNEWFMERGQDHPVDYWYQGEFHQL